MEIIGVLSHYSLDLLLFCCVAADVNEGLGIPESWLTSTFERGKCSSDIEVLSSLFLASCLRTALISWMSGTRTMKAAAVKAQPRLTTVQVLNWA